MSKGGNWVRLRRAGLITTVVGAALLVLPGAAMAATITGTAGPDNLIGTNQADTIYGRRGDDRIAGRGAGDTLYGNRGGDRLFGEGGGDTLYGGRGNDLLVGGAGADSLFGGRGDDVIWASHDNSVDTVNCGPGDDRAFVDATDTVNANCEIVVVMGGPSAR